MNCSYPVSAVITAKEKRQQPIKHYVFIVEVRWSDKSKIPIYRQYSDFAQLHTSLCDVLASMTNVKIQLPVFPSKKVFQRNEIQRVATERRHAFDDYCQALLKLDPLLSRDKVVIDFFKARHDDINPPNESGKQSPDKRPSSLFSALAPFLPGKNKSKDNIKHSRSANNLETLDVDDPIYVSSPIVCQTYIALANYTPEEKGEMKLKESMSVEVVEKYDNGWWFVQTEYGFGWAPATYLTPIGCTDDDEEPEPIYSGHKYLTTESYKAEEDDEITFESGVLIKVLHKLLDGWWIIEYQDKVGYVPATYLVPFNNPHYRDSRYGNRKSRKPTKRRTTIKNSNGRSLNVRKNRDLSIYKKMSTKFGKGEAAAIAKKLAAELTPDTSLLTVPPVKKGNTTKKSVRITESGSATTSKAKLHDYDYIDEDEMEDINEWVDKNIRTSLENPPVLPVRSPDKTSPPVDPENGSAGSGLVHIKPARGSGLSFCEPPSSAAKRHSLPNQFHRAPAAPLIKRSLDDNSRNIGIHEEEPIYNTAAPGMVYAEPPRLNKTPVLPSQFLSYEDDDDVLSPTAENTSFDDTSISSDKFSLRMNNNNQERNIGKSLLYSKVNKDKNSIDQQRQEEQVCAVYNNIPQIKLNTNISGNQQLQQQITSEKQSTSSLNCTSTDIKTTYTATRSKSKEELISKSFEKLFNDINKRGASEEATDFLVGYIQSRSISSVRTNDSGELIITFSKDNSDRGVEFM